MIVVALASQLVQATADYLAMNPEQLFTLSSMHDVLSNAEVVSIPKSMGWRIRRLRNTSIKLERAYWLSEKEIDLLSVALQHHLLFIDYKSLSVAGSAPINEVLEICRQTLAKAGRPPARIP